MSQSRENPSVSELKALMLIDQNLFREKLKKLGGIQGLCVQLNSSFTHGLFDKASVLRNRQLYGENVKNMGQGETEALTLPKIPRLWSSIKHAWGQKELVINRLVLYIRIITAIVAAVLGILLGFSDYDFDDDDEDESVGPIFFFLIETIGYWLIPLLVVTWANRIASSNCVEFMQKNKETIGLTVTRNGVEIQQLPISQLVVGDICHLSKSGSIIPGDGILLDETNQRLFAGEFHMCERQMLVVAVGDNTRDANIPISASIQNQKPNSLLDEQLYAFYRLAIKCAVIFGIVATGLLFLRFSVVKYEIGKNVWAASYFQRFFTLVVTGIELSVLALPEIIPPAMILTQIRHLRKAEDNCILLKNIGVQSKIPRLTVLLIEKSCIGLTKSMDGYLSVFQSLSRQGIRTKVLVTEELDDSRLKECGLNSNELVKITTSKSNVVESMKNSGEIVGYLALGLQSDVEALRAADVGIIMGSAYATKNALTSADVLYVASPTDEEFKTCLEILFVGSCRIYWAIYSILQFRISGLLVLYILQFFATLLVWDSHLSNTQTLWIFIVTALLILGLLCSDEFHITKPFKISAPILFPRITLKNILFQIIYQTLVGLVLIFIYDSEDEFSSLLFDAIVWMTLCNAINCRKWNGECNVFRGLSIRHPFVRVWIVCAISQILIFAFGGLFFHTVRLKLAHSLVCIALGFGTLLVYQISIKIPIWKEKQIQEAEVDEVYTTERESFV